MQNAKAFIIILNYNTWPDTVGCLESVFKTNYENYEVVVVDNKSENDSVEKLREWQAKKNNRFTLLTSDKNMGFAGGNNLGLKFALEKNDFEYVWLLNNDTVVAEDALSALVERAKQLKSFGKKPGILGGKVLMYGEKERIQSFGGRYNKWLATVRQAGSLKREDAVREQDLKVDYVNGAAMFVTKEYLKDVGLMDERYFLYFEELDWTLAGKKKGFETAVCSECRVYHKHGKTLGSGLTALKRSELADYYGIRNRIVFTRKHYPEALFTVYLGLVGVFLKRLLIGKAGVFIQAVRGAKK